MKKQQSPFKELNKKITVESLNNVSDGAGGFEQNWGNRLQIWAKIKQVRISNSLVENYQFEQIKTIKQYELTVRVEQQVDETMRIIYENQTLQIKQIITNDNNLTQTIIAQSGVAL